MAFNFFKSKNFLCKYFFIWAFVFSFGAVHAESASFFSRMLDLVTGNRQTIDIPDATYYEPGQDASNFPTYKQNYISQPFDWNIPAIKMTDQQLNSAGMYRDQIDSIVGQN